MELLYKKTAAPFPVEKLPEVILDARPEFVKLNDFAWRQAWDHVCETESFPRSPFLSEGCNNNRVWIWDSCLMGMFCLGQSSPLKVSVECSDQAYQKFHNAADPFLA